MIHINIYILCTISHAIVISQSLEIQFLLFIIYLFRDFQLVYDHYSLFLNRYINVCFLA
jgi:hypothetical protein